MAIDGSSKPLIRQGWLRVLLFCVFYFILILLSSVPLYFIIRSIKGKDVNVNDLVNSDFLWLSFVVAAVIGLIAVFLFRKIVDRKTFMSLGFSLTDHISDAVAGFLLAITILGIGTIILYFSGHLQWTDIEFSGRDLFIGFGMMVIVAFYEEMVFRGYILNNLMDSFNKWVALIISALLFAIFHIDNPSINIIPIINVFLAGILLGINYIYTKNLWFAILFHLGWNFFQGPVLGYKISGINLPVLLQNELKGDLLLTGGDFGFEGSVINLALTLIAILSLYGIYEKKYKVKQEETP
jgi:uncharacterized protein